MAKRMKSSSGYKLSEQRKLKKKAYRLLKRDSIREYSRRYYLQNRDRVLARTKEYHRIKRLQAKMLEEISESLRNNNDNNNKEFESKSMDMVSTAPT